MKAPCSSRALRPSQQCAEVVADRQAGLHLPCGRRVQNPCPRDSWLSLAHQRLKSVYMRQDDDIPGIVRYRTYEVLKEEVANPKLRWAYLPYSMHMAGPREAIQHMIIRKNYGAACAVGPTVPCASAASTPGWSDLHSQSQGSFSINQAGMRSSPPCNQEVTGSCQDCTSAQSCMHLQHGGLELHGGPVPSTARWPG